MLLSQYCHKITKQRLILLRDRRRLKWKKEKKTIKVRKGTTVKTVPERQKEDYLRNGWYVEKDYANMNPFINSSIYNTKNK